MANWNGAARTNYAKFNDIEGLKKSIEPFDLELWEKEDGFCALGVGGNSDSGGWPSFSYKVLEDGTEEEVEFDFQEHVVPFLADGEVLVAQEVGHEKLRYLTSVSCAFCKGKKPIYLNIDDIYQKAAKKFKVDSRNITHAEY